MVERTPALAPYRALATRSRARSTPGGRAASTARWRCYDALLPLVDGEPAQRNRWWCAWPTRPPRSGADQPRRALADLDDVDGKLADPTLQAHARAGRTPRPTRCCARYRIIAAGLRANAHRAVGELDGAQRALETPPRAAGAALRRARGSTSTCAR